MIVDRWITSSRSNGTGGSNCVQVLKPSLADVVMARNSRTPNGGTLTFTVAERAAFVAGAKAGEFDV
jgi:hypothetical protein